MISDDSLSALTEDGTATSPREVEEIAAELLQARELIRSIVAAFPEFKDDDEPLAGADAIDRLAPLWERATMFADGYLLIS